MIVYALPPLPSHRSALPGQRLQTIERELRSADAEGFFLHFAGCGSGRAELPQERIGNLGNLALVAFVAFGD